MTAYHGCELGLESGTRSEEVKERRSAADSSAEDESGAGEEAGKLSALSNRGTRQNRHPGQAEVRCKATTSAVVGKLQIGDLKKAVWKKFGVFRVSWLAVSTTWRRAGEKKSRCLGGGSSRCFDSHLHEAAAGGFRGNAVRARRRRGRLRAYSADSRCEAVVAASSSWSLRTTRRGGGKKEKNCAGGRKSCHGTS